MRQDFFFDTFAAAAPTNRDIGLAAVAAELHLRIEELDFDAAGAVQKGAAALYLAGFAPKGATSRRGGTAHGAGGARRASINTKRASRSGSLNATVAAN